MDGRVLCLLALMGQRSSVCLVKRASFPGYFLGGATLHVHSVWSDGFNVSMAGLPTRFYCFIHRGVPFFCVAMDLGCPGQLSLFFLQRCNFPCLAFVLLGRAINDASSHLHETVVLFRLRSFHVQVSFYGVGSIIGVHAPRKMSALYVVPCRTSALIFLH